MKKYIIYAISLILIFFLSVYIGIKINRPNEIANEGQEKEQENVQGNVSKNIEINEIEQAVSESKGNKEHYVLREVSEYIKVYSIDDDEKEELYLSTNISTEYLPETDKLSLKEGIHVYSKEELNEILQDFE